MALILPRFEVLDGRMVGARYEMMTASEVAGLFGYHRPVPAGGEASSPATAILEPRFDSPAPTPPPATAATAGSAAAPAPPAPARPRPRRRTAPRRVRTFGVAPVAAGTPRPRAGHARRHHARPLARPATRPQPRRWTAADTAGVATAVLLVLSLLAAWAILALAVAQHVFGYETLTVLSGSMRPTIPVGAMVVEHKVPAGSIRVGDVISFHPGNNRAIMVTHRVVDIRTRTVNGAPEAYFVTRGDANPIADPGGVPARGDVGRVTANYPLVGYATWWLQKPEVRTVMLLLPLGLMATMVASHLLRPRRPRLA